jgi:hypothetical protein
LPEREEILEYLGAVAVTPVLTGSQEASGMYGLIVKITVHPGKRDEMIGVGDVETYEALLVDFASQV